MTDRLQFECKGAGNVMTREKFEAIDDWAELYSYMVEEEYYGFVPEGWWLYTRENDLCVDLGESILNNRVNLRDISMIGTQVDSNADVWVANNGFSRIYSYWDDDFFEIKEEFGEWLCHNNAFDDSQEGSGEASNKNFERRGLTDDALNALLFGI